MSDIKKILESIDRIAREGTMSSSAKHKSGPKFGGYWKGTDPNPPKPGQGVGGCSEEVGEDKAYLGEPHIREGETCPECGKDPCECADVNTNEGILDTPVEEKYGLHVGDSIVMTAGAYRSKEGHVLDLNFDGHRMEVLFSGPDAGRSAIVDVRDTQALDENYLGRMEGGATFVEDDDVGNMNPASYEDHGPYCNCEDCCWARDGEEICPSCGCLASQCPGHDLDEDSWSDGVGQWSSGPNAWSGDGKNAWSGGSVSEDTTSDPELARLEQEVRNALDKGDDYIAKQYAKMAPTTDGKRYLSKIIRQEMYSAGDDPITEDDDESEQKLEALYDCEYVQDLVNGNEVFRMSGDPYDRRVQIVDKNGRGWNISPSRLTPVYDERLIARWFPDSARDDDGNDDDDLDEMIGEAKPVSLMARVKEVAPGDQVSRDKEGNFVFRKGYYYRMGMDSQKFANNVKNSLEKAGLNVEVVDHGDHWAAFRGGASIKASSHFWVKARVTECENGSCEGYPAELGPDYEPIEEADMPDLERNRAIAGAKVDDKADPEKLAIWWSHYRRAIGNKQGDRQARDYADRMTATEPKFRPNPFVAKESMDAGDYLNPDWGLCKAEDGGWYVRKLYRRPRCVAGPFDTMLDANINRLSQDFKDDYDVAQYSSAAHDFVKPIKEESVEDITEELKKAFEDYVSNEKYSDDTLYPPKSKKASVDKKKEKKPKVVEPNVLDEGASSQEVGDAIAYRISRQKPELITKYGVEALADAIDDVASFHAGAEELGTSDISIMVNQVVKNLERDYVKESEERVYGVKDKKGYNVHTGTEASAKDYIKQNPGKGLSLAKIRKPGEKKVEEGKKPSANRELWDKVNRKGVQAPIDRERYTDLSYQGLEGPFRMKTGKVLYYDTKAGKYYDRDSDMYVSDEDMYHINMHGIDEDVEGYHAHHRWENVPQRMRQELARRAEEEKWKRHQTDYEWEKQNPFKEKDVDEAKSASRARSILQKKLDDLERMNKPVPTRPEPVRMKKDDTGEWSKVPATGHANYKKPLDEEEALLPHAVQLFQLMQPETRKDMVKYLDSLRKNYGPEKSLQTYRMAQKMRQANKDMPKRGVDEAAPQIDPATGQPIQQNTTSGQQPAVNTATPITTPQTTAQQPPAPKGTPTAVPAPGQPMLPKAGQAGGAPVAPPPGTPKPETGSGVNTTTTPIQGLATSLQQLAQPGAQMAAKKAADALARVK